MSKKDEGGFLPFDLANLEPDPAVSALIGRGQAREADRRLPVKERGRKAKQRAKDAARHQALYDLPLEVLRGISELAEAKRTTASGVACLALVRLLEDVKAGRLDLDEYLYPIDSPRYMWRVGTCKNHD